MYKKIEMRDDKRDNKKRQMRDVVQVDRRIRYVKGAQQIAPLWLPTQKGYMAESCMMLARISLLRSATLAEDGNYLPLHLPLGIPLALGHKDWF